MLKLHHWYVCLLLVNVPLCGMLNSDKVDYLVYEDYKTIVDERIQQGLKGDDLIKPADEVDRCNLLKRLVYADNSENDPRYSDYSDLRQRIVEYDPAIKKLDGFYKAFLASVWKQRKMLTQWFITEGVNVNLRPRDALEYAVLDINTQCVNQVVFIVRLLLLHNVNPNIQNEFGFTNLHWMVDSVKENDLCSLVSLLIVGGADCSLKTYNYGSRYKEKMAIEIAQINDRFQFARIIELTSLQRDSLFAVVAKGKAVPFRSTSDEEFKSWISRRHVRDIHGNSLLHCAFANNNFPVAQRLVYLWPRLLTQSNFKGKTVLDLFPQKCIELLGNPNSVL